jgi:predicted enzyme related to lactoylglutathione lyase
MNNDNPVVHFEMPYEDAKRVADFYQKAFDWGMDDTGNEMGNYIVAKTTETGDNGRPIKAGSINGGFYLKKTDRPAQYPSLVIAVNDMSISIQSVTDAGGKILGEPIDIPTVGKYVSFTDSEGNRVTLLQPM